MASRPWGGWVDNYMAKTEGTATELEIILYFIIMWKMRWRLLALTSCYPQHWEYGCNMVWAQETFPGWMSEGTQAFHCIPCPYPGKTSPVTEGKNQIFDTRIKCGVRNVKRFENCKESAEMKGPAEGISSTVQSSAVRWQVVATLADVV